MSRLHIPSFEESSETSKPLLNAVHQQLGMIPNLMKLIGNSPAGLEGYLSLNGALAKGKLNVKLRERIALAIAEFNGCDYCLSAHDYLGRNVAKLTDDEIEAARIAHAENNKDNIALQFALKIAQSRGRVDQKDIDTLRTAGFDDASMIEIVINVSLNILTNYVNNVALTDIDFPIVHAKHAN